MCGYVTTSCGQFVLLAIYRPSSQALSTVFYDDLSAVLKYLTTFSCPDIICGDFNILVDQVDDLNAIRLHQLLQLFGHIQHVTGQTRAAGHTLDLVLTRTDTVVYGVCIGDTIVLSYVSQRV